MNKHWALLLLAVASASGAAAHADTVLVDRASYGNYFRGVDYHFNAEQGSAWVDVRFDADVPGVPGNHGITYTPVTDKLKWVQGLSYDAAAAQLVFVGSAGKFVCATVTHQGAKDWIKATGSCRFYSVQEHHGVSVYFEAK